MSRYRAEYDLLELKAAAQQSHDLREELDELSRYVSAKVMALAAKYPLPTFPKATNQLYWARFPWESEEGQGLFLTKRRHVSITKELLKAFHAFRYDLYMAERSADGAFGLNSMKYRLYKATQNEEQDGQERESGGDPGE